MNFTNSDSPITEAQIVECEANSGIRLPASLRSTYLKYNGGEPDPYVFQDDRIDTVVSEFLPLKSMSRGSAVRSYELLVKERAIVPSNFFPFAVDGGGDYFFVDMNTPDGKVFFFLSDSTDVSALHPLGMGLYEFWDALIPE